MNILKKTIISLIIVSVFLCFTNCKEKGYYTGINEIDKKYKFQYKHIVEEDSLYPRMELFCNKTLKDSIYTIGTKEENGYKIRIRGWGFNQKRVGDWYYEKIYNDGMVITDSIINYIVFCDKNPINTIKKFKNNYLDKSAGYFYEVEMKENVFDGDTLEIKMNFVFDTVHFEKKAANTFYLFNPPSHNDYCDATKYIIDSIPVYKNSTTMRFLMDEKGKIKLSGYYLLFPKKQREQFTATQVFTEINFEVK